MAATAVMAASWGRVRWKRGTGMGYAPAPMNPAGSLYEGDANGGPIGLAAELYLGAAGWVDITDFVYYRDRVSISRGRPDEASQVQPQTCSLTLDNRDRRFSPRNPYGPYYGLLGRNTPIRISRMQNGVRRYRFTGEVPQWPTTSDITASDLYIQVSAAGPLRRYNQGSAVLGSAIYRWYTLMTGASAPLAYWPCEDSAFSASIASGLPTGASMSVTGSPAFAADSSFLASGAIAQLGSSTWSGAVPAAAGSPSLIAFRFLLDIPATGGTNNGVIASLHTSGTIARIDLIYGTGGGLGLNGYNTAGTLILSYPPSAMPGTGFIDGVPGVLELDLATNGSGVDYNLFFSPATGAGGGNLNTLSNATLGQPTQVVINRAGTFAGGTGIGHISIQTAADNALFSALVPFQAWSPEGPALRFTRLCSEQSLNSAVQAYGQIGNNVLMGAQLSDTFPNLVQEVPNSDMGMLYEAVDQVALVQRTRLSLYNQGSVYNPAPPSLTLDYAQHQLAGPPIPQDDDLYTANDVTVSRVNGSSARAQLSTGAMSTQAPPVGVGDYQKPYTVSLYEDTLLPDQASWRVLLGTVAGPRFPQLHVNLRHPSFTSSVALTTQALTVDIGDVITIVNPPAELGPDPVTAIIQGYQEVMGVYEHEIVFNTSPASPYSIAVCDDVQLAHADTDGSTLAADAPAAASSMQFATTNQASPVWTMNPVDWPFDVAVGGERVTVLGPGGSLNADPLLLEGTGNYIGQNATIALDPTVQWPVDSQGLAPSPYGGATIRVTPLGGHAIVDTVCLNSAIGTVLPSTSYTVWGWVYSQTGRSYMVFANWVDGGVYQSTSTGASTPSVAGLWLPLQATVTSPASSVNQANLGIMDANTPTSGQTYNVFGINGAASSALDTTSPQSVSVIRSVNGVTKYQSAGTDVRLWQPMIPGL